MRRLTKATEVRTRTRMRQQRGEVGLHMCCNFRSSGYTTSADENVMPVEEKHVNWRTNVALVRALAIALRLQARTPLSDWLMWNDDFSVCCDVLLYGGDGGRALSQPNPPKLQTA